MKYLVSLFCILTLFGCLQKQNHGINKNTLSIRHIPHDNDTSDLIYTHEDSINTGGIFPARDKTISYYFFLDFDGDSLPMALQQQLDSFIINFMKRQNDKATNVALYVLRETDITRGQQNPCDDDLFTASYFYTYHWEYGHLRYKTWFSETRICYTTKVYKDSVWQDSLSMGRKR